MVTTYSTGESIDSWCSKCKLELGHTIVAIVDNAPKKVKCNTCNSQHNFRSKPLSKSRKKSATTSRKRKSKETTYEEYFLRLQNSDPANSRTYDSKENYKEDEIIVHLRFGIGIVLSVIQTNKLKILFKDGPKLLIQNQ